MKVTIVGVLIFVGAIVVLAVLDEKLAENIKKKPGPNNEQPDSNS